MAEAKVVKAIAAMDPNHVIGNGTGFPDDWNYPKDLEYFREVTAGMPILMGRGTYEALPEGRRPLPGRLNIVATSNPDGLMLPAGVLTISDPVQFIEEFVAGSGPITGNTLWVIGGGQIYAATMPLWDELHLTIVSNEHQGETKFPEFRELFDEDIALRREEPDLTFHVFRRKNR